MVLTACPDDSTSHGLRSVLVRMSSLPQGEGVWGSWTTLRHSVLERLGVEMKTSARHCKKLSTCCTAVMPRMSFSSCYTLSTPLVEGAGKVFRSVTAVTIFWLALAKVGSSPPPLAVGRYGPFRLERGLTVVKLGQLGLDGCSFSRELATSLRGPALSISL
jgi:hypothetical protein